MMSTKKFDLKRSVEIFVVANNVDEALFKATSGFFSESLPMAEDVRKIYNTTGINTKIVKFRMTLEFLSIHHLDMGRLNENDEN